MLVVKVVDKTHLLVIHYTNNRGSQSSGSSFAVSEVTMQSGISFAAKIVEEKLLVDPAKEIVQLLEFPDTMTIYEGKAAVQRARSKRGEESYNIFWNNCESFVNWCITGQKKSPQGEKALETAGKIGVATAVVAGIVMAPVTFGFLLGAAAVGVGVFISNNKGNVKKP